MNSTKTNSLVQFLAVLFLAVLIQSCSPSNEVQPLHLAPNTITVKVGDMDAPTIQVLPKHLVITSASGYYAVILDTTISGNFVYNFTCTQSNLSLKATLTAVSPFVCSLEIDRNSK